MQPVHVCQHDVEKISHMFCYCKRVPAICLYFLGQIHEKWHVQNMKFNPEYIVLGLRKNTYTDCILNLLILLTLLFICKSKESKIALNILDPLSKTGILSKKPNLTIEYEIRFVKSGCSAMSLKMWSNPVLLFLMVP